MMDFLAQAVLDPVAAERAVLARSSMQGSPVLGPVLTYALGLIGIVGVVWKGVLPILRSPFGHKVIRAILKAEVGERAEGKTQSDRSRQQSISNLSEILRRIEKSMENREINTARMWERIEANREAESHEQGEILARLESISIILQQTVTTQQHVATYFQQIHAQNAMTFARMEANQVKIWDYITQNISRYQPPYQSPPTSAGRS